MPIPPSPPLDETIDEGQFDHVRDHEVIADALNNDTMSLTGAQPVSGVKTFTIGSLLDLGSVVADARGYGAVGDGVADDTTAIQDAIDAVAAVPGGGYVFLAAGDWKTSDILDVPANVTLVGAGWGATELKPIGGFGPCVRLKGAAGTGTAVSYAGVRDIGIQGSNGAALTGDDGIQLDNVFGITLTNVRIRQVRGRGINMYRRCFEVYGFNIYVIDTKQTGVQFGDSTFSASDDQANGNEIHGLHFGPMTPRCVDYELAHSNKIFGIDIQSPPTGIEWVRFTNSATNNTIWGINNFDAVAAGALSCILFDGGGAQRNHIHDWELGMAGIPIFKFANGATGNVVTWGRYTGSPSAVYTADASSTNNWLDGMYFSLTLAAAGSSKLTSVSHTNRENVVPRQTQVHHYTLAPPSGVENIKTALCVNGDGGAIAAGTAVGRKTPGVGVSNGLPQVGASNPHIYFVGVALEALPNTGTREGRVVTEGLVTTTLDTSASSLTASVWCGPSGLTLTQPDGGVLVGWVASLAAAGQVWLQPRTPMLGSAAYTTTNVSADRAFDANATTLDELADVVGTLIADLKANQILR